MSTTSKSPLHSEALVFGDLEMGMNVIVFSVYDGEWGEFVVQELPPSPNSQRVAFRSVKDGPRVVYRFYSGDIGLVPYIGTDGPHWNPGNFTIKAAKRHLLPSMLLADPDDRDDIRE